MKASIFLATKNKLDGLMNVFHSINWQKTSFPFEVIIFDDASDAGQDPYPLLMSKALRVPWKYARSNKGVGYRTSQSKCLKVIDEKSDIIVLQSSDVLYGSKDTLEKLCKGVKKGVATMCEVRNVAVPTDLHKDWDKLPYYLEEERLQETLRAINSDPRQPRMGKYTLAHTIFSGERQPAPASRWYFFLGAIRKEDLLKTCFPTTCYDVALSKSMHHLGMEVSYVDAIGLHQKHPLG